MKTIETKNHKLGRTITINLNSFDENHFRMSIFQGKRINHNYECRFISDYEAINI